MQLFRRTTASTHAVVIPPRWLWGDETTNYYGKETERMRVVGEEGTELRVLLLPQALRTSTVCVNYLHVAVSPGARPIEAQAFLWHIKAREHRHLGALEVHFNFPANTALHFSLHVALSIQTVKLRQWCASGDGCDILTHTRRASIHLSLKMTVSRLIAVPETQKPTQLLVNPSQCLLDAFCIHWRPHPGVNTCTAGGSEQTQLQERGGLKTAPSPLYVDLENGATQRQVANGVG